MLLLNVEPERRLATGVGSWITTIDIEVNGTCKVRFDTEAEEVSNGEPSQGKRRARIGVLAKKTIARRDRVESGWVPKEA